MTLFLLWFFFSIAAGMFAHIRRNRNGVEWFLIAFLISPLVAFVLLAILKPRSPEDNLLAMERQRRFNKRAYIAVAVIVIAMVLPFVIGATALAVKSML